VCRACTDNTSWFVESQTTYSPFVQYPVAEYHNGLYLHPPPPAGRYVWTPSNVYAFTNSGTHCVIEWDPGASSPRAKKWSYPNRPRPAVCVHRLSRPPSSALNLHVPYLASTWPLQVLHSRLRHPRTYPQRPSLCEISSSVVYFVVPYSQSLTGSLQMQLAILP
jgi:hypothetical protein